MSDRKRERKATFGHMGAYCLHWLSRETGGTRFTFIRQAVREIIQKKMRIKLLDVISRLRESGERPA